MTRVGHMVDETPYSFRIDPRIYDDAAIFDLEMERIFEKTWVYVGHESEVQAPGAYFTSMIGLNPVIVSRGRDLQLRVFLNVCRHRGSVLCRGGRGVATTFTCRYHGWAYNDSGDLATIPMGDGYSERFRKAKGDLGLLQARVAVYRGLIFANLRHDGESLDRHLGAVKPFVDLWADQSPVGTLRTAKPHSYAYSGNWKFQVENGVDNYHPTFVHASAFDALQQMGMQRYQSGERRAQVKASVTYGFNGGHCILQRPGLETVYTVEQFDRYRDQLLERHPTERVDEIATIRHVHIFPNVLLMDALIRVIQPLAVDRTNVHSYFVNLDGVPEEVNIARLDDCQRRLGTAGFVGPDDVEIFAGNQTGIRSRALKELILDRGIEGEQLLPDGTRIGGATDETPQRAIYRAWKIAMTSAATSVEPVPHAIS